MRENGYCFALQHSCSWWSEEIGQHTKCGWYYLGLTTGFPLSEKGSEVRVDVPTSLRNTWRKGVIFQLPLVSEGRCGPCFMIFCSFSLPVRPRPYARKHSPSQINTQGREISIKMSCNSCPHGGYLRDDDIVPMAVGMQNLGVRLHWNHFARTYRTPCRKRFPNASLKVYQTLS